jgi:DNA-binding CsgD family transcriptional regulator
MEQQMSTSAVPAQRPAANRPSPVHHERAFWPEQLVLQLPTDTDVATRPLNVLDGNQEPRQAVRPGPVHDAAQPAAATRALEHALRSGNADLAFAHALVLSESIGLRQTYELMSRCLSDLASSWAAGTSTVLAEHRATKALSQVTDRLSALTPRPRREGNVLLTVPPGDQHTVALAALAHVISADGWPSQVLDALPTAELEALASAPETVAVVVSAHNPATRSALRGMISTLRTAAPGVLIAVGGPGLPQVTGPGFGADVVTDDVCVLLQRLSDSDTALTDRETEVLTAVADGLTNAEIASRLCVAPTTVKRHLDHILAKTGSDHRAGAVAVGLRRGWIR